MQASGRAALGHVRVVLDSVPEGLQTRSIPRAPGQRPTAPPAPTGPIATVAARPPMARPVAVATSVVVARGNLARSAYAYLPHPPQLAPGQWRGLACFALALGCLWYLDALTTSWALRRGAIEVGPVARHLVSDDMLRLIAAKAVGLGAIVLIAAMQLAKKRDRLAGWSLGTVGAISVGIVEWNLLGVLVIAGVLG